MSDTGEGISGDYLPHVFDRFSQADTSATRSYNGLGMGLAIVRHVVEMHGGTVQAESAGKGKGAKFVVKLPMQQGEGGFSALGAGEFVSREKRSIAHGKECSFNINLSGVLVLVADNDEDSLDFARMVLEECGAEVETAVSAWEALEAIKRRSPDVFVSDLAMPMAHGKDLIRQVRTISGATEVPAVALTAYGRVEERVRALRLGFQIHLSKPIDPVELVVTVASLVSRTK